MNNKNDSRVLIFVAMAWLAAAITSFPHLSRAEGAISGNSETGKQLFEKRCTGCHSHKEQGGPATAKASTADKQALCQISVTPMN